MARLACSDYGFECSFVAEGEIKETIEKFGRHTLQEHGIEYSKDVLTQFILRQSKMEIPSIAKFVCRDYGFDCEFVTEGDRDITMERFAKHTLSEHGIEYSREVLTQFVLRQKLLSN